MIEPFRFQLHRVKGWKMPPHSVVVTRNTMWGNPFYFRLNKGLYKPHLDLWEVRFYHKLINRDYGVLDTATTEEEAKQKAVNLFAKWFDHVVAEPGTELYEFRMRYGWRGFQLSSVCHNLLHGKNIGCFCEEGTACHGNIILQRANPGRVLQ